MKLSTHLHLLARLRIYDGALPPATLKILMSWRLHTEKTSPFYINIHLLKQILFLHKQELASQYVQNREIKFNVIIMDSSGDRAMSD